MRNCQLAYQIWLSALQVVLDASSAVAASRIYNIRIIRSIISKAHELTNGEWCTCQMGIIKKRKKKK